MQDVTLPTDKTELRRAMRRLRWRLRSASFSRVASTPPYSRKRWRRRESREGLFHPLDLVDQVGAVYPGPRPRTGTAPFE